MNDTGSLLGSGIFMIIYLAIVVLYIAGMWAIFSKAGQPGWAAIIPIYNVYVLCKTVGRPGWWVILFFIPLVNFVIMLIVLWDLAKAFGHGGLMWLGLLFLGWIFIPVIGFGGSQYQLARPA
jgi:hypothetical protein